MGAKKLHPWSFSGVKLSNSTVPPCLRRKPSLVTAVTRGKRPGLLLRRRFGGRLRGGGRFCGAGGGGFSSCVLSLSRPTGAVPFSAIFTVSVAPQAWVVKGENPGFCRGRYQCRYQTVRLKGLAAQDFPLSFCRFFAETLPNLPKTATKSIPPIPQTPAPQGFPGSSHRALRG